MSKFDCTVSFTYELNTWIRGIVSEEIGEGQEANDPIATGDWCSKVTDRIEALEGFVGETSVEDLESTVDSLTNLNSNETNIDDLDNRIDNLEGMTKKLKRLVADVDVDHLEGKVDDLVSDLCLTASTESLNKLEARCATLLEQQLINQVEITALQAQVNKLTKWIAGFRLSILVATGNPSFLVNLDPADLRLADVEMTSADTPALNPRHVHDDAAADELISMIDDVTESLKPELDGGAQTT